MPPPFDPPAAPVPRKRFAWWNVVFFLAALAIFDATVDHFSSPFQGADKVEKKFAYFAAHKDEYDMVFVGSSRVMNQLSPKTFDAEMAAAGRPCRSFNLGFAGMFLPECLFLLDQVRALHPTRLRGLIVELSAPAPHHDDGHPLTGRDIYWHHFEPTLLASATVWTDPDSVATPWERAAQVWLQTTIFARCAVHLGDGPRLADDLRKSLTRRLKTPAPDRELLGPGQDGFFPLLHTLGQSQSHAAKTGGSTADLLAFQRMVERMRVKPAVSPDVSPGPAASPLRRWASSVVRDLLARKFSALGRTGIRPLAFIGPGTTREQLFLDLHADGTLPTLFAFNDPDAHPDLYALDVRADRNHLNAAGADLLSRQLALAVAASVPPPAQRRRQ